MERWGWIFLLAALLFPVLALGEDGGNLKPWQAENGLWGYVDDAYEWVISPRFDEAYAFRGDYAQVRVLPEDDGGKAPWYVHNADGIIGRDGQFVLPPEYDIESGWYDGWGEFGTWAGGYYTVTQAWADPDSLQMYEHGLMGFFDVRSGCFSGLKFEQIWDTWNDGDLIPVVETRDGIEYLGYADRTTGDMALPCEFYLNWQDEVTAFPEGAAALAHVIDVDEDDGEAIPGDFFLVTAQGEIIPLPDGLALEYAREVREGLIGVMDRETKLWGFMDAKGNVVIPPRFVYVGDFQDGLARVMLNDENMTEALIDRAGNVVLREEEEQFSVALSDGARDAGAPRYAFLGENDLYGYIDARGNVVMPPQFEEAEDFRGRYAYVKVFSKVTGILYDGLMDDQGQWVFPPESGLRVTSSRWGKYFGGEQTGFYTIRTSGRSGYLDVTNGFFSGFAYDNIPDDRYEAGQALIPVVMDKKLGYADRATGEIVIPCRYDPEKSGGLKNGYAIVRRPEEEHDFLIDETGRALHPPVGTKINRSGWFENGLFPVVNLLETRASYMTKEGTLAFPLTEYEYAGNFLNGYASVRTLEGDWAEIDTEGNIQTAEHHFLPGGVYYVTDQENGGRFISLGPMLRRCLMCPSPASIGAAVFPKTAWRGMRRPPAWRRGGTPTACSMTGAKPSHCPSLTCMPMGPMNSRRACARPLIRNRAWLASWMRGAAGRSRPNMTRRGPLRTAWPGFPGR
ncbi:MAG: WG repeat-containing protein [Clostridia bacterium]|nr:WG repeat-containing protein [Clostridia bacterium]